MRQAILLPQAAMAEPTPRAATEEAARRELQAERAEERYQAEYRVLQAEQVTQADL